MDPASDFALGNGMRFIVAPDHAVPAAAFGVWTRAGVCDEPPERRGIAHYFEHMMFRGSERFGPKEHTAAVARTGGNCNAYTNFDETVYWEFLPSAELELAFELEADRFRRLRLEADGAATEKKVVLEELRVYENQPMTRALRRLLRALGGEHPYALDPLGRTEDLGAVSVEDLAAWWRRLYRPGNVFAVASGDVNVERVRELAEKHFGDWRDPEGLTPPTPPPRFLPAVGRRAERVSVEVPLAVRLHRLPPSAELDSPALELLVALLADGESSPVRETLVKKTRLCVHAGAQSFRLLHGGALVFFGAFLPPGSHRPRHQALAAICDRLAAEGPEAGQFEVRLRRFRRDRAAESYSCRRRLEGLGEAELREGGYARYERALQDLAAVTPERVQDLARRLFAPENTLELDVVPERTRWWMPLAGLFARFIPR